jgi:glutamyl-Q tRNA(Asp) synthetase
MANSLPVAQSGPVLRFAPSPNGYLHLGHARSALINADLAGRMGGRFLLRIEDIDPGRTRENFVQAIVEDLAWLGLDWEKPVLRQSTRFDAYRAALDTLDAQGLVYPCFCTRLDLAKAVAADCNGGLPHDPDGTPLYPGTCRKLPAADRQKRMATERYALRIDMMRFAEGLGALAFSSFDPVSGEIAAQQAQPSRWGDAIIMRKDCPASYHLAVVIDDAFQGVTHVVRGADLSEATHLHAALQKRLGLPSPLYHHHALLLGPDGRKLSKSFGSQSLRELRQAGISAQDVRRIALG